MAKLDVGCGMTRRLDEDGVPYIRMDKLELTEPDILWDIENIPWEAKDDTYEEILMSHVIEHVKPNLVVDVMNECWRVMGLDGLLRIAVPEASSFRGDSDPTHYKGWTDLTIWYFCPENPAVWSIYMPKPWRMDKMWRNSSGDYLIEVRKIAENKDVIDDISKRFKESPSQDSPFGGQNGGRRRRDSSDEETENKDT